MSFVTSPYEAESPPVGNGQTPMRSSEAPTPPAGSSGPKMPKRYAWIDIPEYEGFRAKVWLNYPDEWLKKEMAAAKDADRQQWQPLKRIVLEHNGWTDEEGPLPDPSEDAFWERIPNELLAFILAGIASAPGKALASLRKSGQL